MVDKEDPVEQLRSDEALIRQAGESLIQTGHLILTALDLQHYSLLDWPEICGYVLEQSVWAAEAAGMGPEDIREALLAVKTLDDDIKKRYSE